jgi:hypothetical protein
VSFTFRCALIFVDTYAHTLLLEVNFVFSKKTRYLLKKWKLCEEKNHYGVAKPRNSTIQKQSKLESTRTHKIYCSSHTFNYNMKPIMNASQPSLLLERVFDGFLYLRADP